MLEDERKRLNEERSSIMAIREKFENERRLYSDKTDKEKREMWEKLENEKKQLKELLDKEREEISLAVKNFEKENGEIGEIGNR